MKKLIATVSALALTAGFAFGETHETLKAHTLQTSIGDISFGAWGRSTFEFGHRSDSTKITADATELGETVVTAGTTAYTAYATAAGTEAKAITDEAFAEDFASKMGATLGTDGVTQALQAIQGMGLVSTMKGLEDDTTDTSNYAALNPDWSYGNRIGFWIIGRTPDEHFGFDFNLDADARALFVHKLWDSNENSEDVNYNEDGKYAVAIGDQAKMWGLFDTPFGLQTKVAFGKMREQTLRGTIGDFGQRESSDVKSEDDIMSEFWPTTGLYVSLTGQEDSLFSGFHIAGAIDLSGTLGTTEWSGGTTTSGYSAGDTDNDEDMPLYYAMRTGQAGVGYTIPGLMQVKAQYWGDSISEYNYRYAASDYKSARDAGYGLNDYYGRMEFGIDWLGFMGGATSFLDPNLNLEETPNANLIELGVKVPIVTREGLRDYDPEKFYNWYACLGTMGVIQKGFILYKAHLWGGQGTSNLEQYSYNLITMDKGCGADILMAGFDFLAEVCVNPFGKQDVFVGLSGNYNITSASAEGGFTYSGNNLSIEDLELRQHKFAAELYVKKTFASNNFMFAGIAGNFSFQSMKGTVNSLVDLSYKSSSKKFYMPIGVELFF